MTSVIVPVIKDKNKRISDKNNYRPICLSNVITKVLERVLHTRIDVYMCTMHNQFGFKSKLGTDICVYVLKELLHYYVSHGSQMYACFLDASRAFDRANHTKLLIP